ncbi:hypothetical protein H696_03232 [Fonticula alba]|uniref:EGF-like domain-containing protein n=1 Tax=Fonticula alba TaxID=691883 RepID=A0A058Z8C0_FONAL|nr:hypothetical protein H696_03232 [Fonticula alba]KCV69787.1 hypothetical protein H696_03232 [Fonticula alba]|eukprot:XP_009495393.1 hypothetical protein H696_03232 [Fonticula alba]
MRRSTAGARLRARPGPLLPWLLAALLAALVHLAAPAPGPDFFLHMCPRQSLPSGNVLGVFAEPTGTSMVATLSDQAAVHIFPQLQQANAPAGQSGLDGWTDALRFGAVFSTAHEASLACARPTELDTGSQMMILPVHGQQAPLIVEHTPLQVALMDDNRVLTLPAPATELLAGLAIDRDTALLLGLVGARDAPTRSISLFLLQRGASALLPVSVDVGPVGNPVLVAPMAATARGFHVHAGHNLHRIVYNSGSSRAGVTTQSHPGIRQLAATRLLSDGPPASDWPDSGDLVLVLSTGLVEVMPCRELPCPESSRILLDLLPGGSGSSGCFLNPGVEAMGRALSLLYYLELPEPPRPPVLWRMDALAKPKVWNRAVLPPGVRDLDRAQLVLLDAGPATTRWGLLAGGRIYLESGDMACHVDSSIRCDGSAGATGSPLGWSCAPGRAESPFARDGSLCDGCAQGWYQDRGDEDAPCKACSPGCRVCDAGNCLVCEDDRRLEGSGAGGSTICVAQCSEGHVLLAGVCQPAGQARPSSRLALPAVHPLPDVHPTTPIGEVVAIGETHLALLPITREVGLPAGVLASPLGPRAGVLLAMSTGQMLLEPGSNIGQPAEAQTPPTPVPHFADHKVEHAMSFAEVGPLPWPDRPAGTLGLGYLMCDTSGVLWQLPFRCEVSSDRGDAGCTSLTRSSQPTSMGPCRGVRLAGARQVAAIDQQGWVTLFTLLLPAGFQEVAPARPFGIGLPPGSRPLMAVPVPEWLLLGGTDATPGGTASPGSLFAGDRRLTALADRALADPGAWSQAVLLPSGRLASARRVDLALSLVRPSGEWEAALLPGDMVPHGRTIDLALTRQAIGQVPGAPIDPSATMVLGTALAGWPGYPAGLLLLADHLVGLAPLDCSATGPAPCVFLPASFAELAPGLRGLGRRGAVRRPVGPNGPPGLVLSLWAMTDDHVAPVRLDIFSTCPPGTFGVECQPCDAICQACHGPGPADCTVCRAWLAGQPETCLAECPPGQYPDLLTGQCGCHAECKQCQAQASGEYQCVACHPGQALAPGDSRPDRCHACHDTCAECAVPGDPATCTACGPARFLHAGICHTECPSGLWADARAGQCIPCPGGCASCSSADMCSACQPGHFLPPGSGTCLPCDGSCGTCAEAGACATCRPGLVFLQPDPQVASLCASTCPPGEYVGPNRCTECQTSSPSGATGQCVPCDPGCASCTADRCLACEPGLFLDSHGDCVSTCPDGTFADAESCQPCDLSCATCVGGGADQCASCAAGLDFVPASASAGTCVSGCPEGQHRDRVSGDCLPCDAACATCNGPSDKDCWRCASGVLQDGDCVQHCAAKHVALAGRCLPCHVSCDQCVGVRLTECQACPGDLLALPAGESPMRCVPACPVGYNASGAGCAKCGDHCASCPGQPDACALCDRGWLLDAPLCVASCPDGSSPQGGLCATCHGTCATCYGPGSQHCLSCRPRWPLQVDGACFAVCPRGTFQTGQTCLPCNATCTACKGPAADQCESCPADRFHLNGTCMLECPGGFFADEGACRPCQATCLTRNLSTDRSSVLVNTLPELNAMTVRYAAPEVIGAFQRGISLDRAALLPADIFSAAVMLWECLARDRPWTDLDFGDIRASVLAGHRPSMEVLVLPGRCFANAPDLLEAAWQADFERRPTAGLFRQRCAAFYLAAGGLARPVP